jgi:pimeloyl-ACP methyl ester carboxylesterase
MGASQRLLGRTLEPLYTDFNACNAYASGLGRAAKVACPALLISGARDLMTPAPAAKSIAEKLAGSESLVIPGTGHDLMQEQPDAVLDALIPFL